jgi:hypothetical protein
MHHIGEIWQEALIMKLTRMRLTIRSLMVVISLVALTIVYVVPASQGLLWLYRNPKSTDWFQSRIVISSRDHAYPSNPALPLGRPIVTEVSSSILPDPKIPPGIPYRMDVEVKLTDPTTRTIIHETQRRSWRVVTGSRETDERLGKAEFQLTPRQPGSYALRYEVHVIDGLGRKSTHTYGSRRPINVR